VLDASALLALLYDEPGGQQVAREIDGALISAVNWTEVLQRAGQDGVGGDGLLAGVEALGLTVESYDAEHAELVAGLRATTRRAGLSLADRACLALAQQRDLTVLTADRAWRKLDLPVEVRLIR